MTAQRTDRLTFTAHPRMEKHHLRHFKVQGRSRPYPRHAPVVELQGVQVQVV